MPSISKILKKEIKENLEKDPLGADEFRRITGMGSHYISLQQVRKSVPYFFSLEIDGKKYFVHK